MTTVQSGWPVNSGTSGTSQAGGSSWGWYQAKVTPLRSTVGNVRSRALRFWRSL